MKKWIINYINQSHLYRNTKKGWHLEWSVKGDLEIWHHKKIALNKPSKDVLTNARVINPNFPTLTRKKICTLLSARWIKILKLKP